MGKTRIYPFMPLDAGTDRNTLLLIETACKFLDQFLQALGIFDNENAKLKYRKGVKVT